MKDMLKGKVALVTGASRGIGKAIALGLAENGAAVAVNYSSSESSALEVAEIIRKNGGKAEIFKARVNEEAEVEEMFSAVEKKLGPVDILVNNAGITKDNLLMRMKTEEWDMVIDVNLKGAFLCTRRALKGMMKNRYGKIINISSVVGFSGNAGQFNYSATKAGVIGMTKSAALECASRGIRVNAVAPGFIETDMTASISDDMKAAYMEKIPLKSLGKPEDIANAVIYLASPLSDYMTGQTLHLNGGMYL
ncbi:3-oxoacyl-(acyl-carrier-protein) reductase [Mucispirillum schaedleri ASF457]|jgi:3-oxoacyl-[acyl-carrier protein] reductase|uniref:3-oxoacyl-[acyl-carrier-protein] reductase n=2 Tax=Mucispirillum TaxID=248038 RepID=V2QIA8_9BACT|nr:3-oxoacyl-[acyl-carrier-protein] reductase FabG [Mucispirillum schaedleri ASF457]SIW06704.1 3-oxoacyl-(acyl-carrier-protein) reductase [Mucispirillum schaedleri ASF457]